MTELGYIDTHCHYDLCLERGVTSVVYPEKPANAKISALILPGLHPTQWQTAKTLCENACLPIYQSIGLHPWWIEEILTKNTVTTLNTEFDKYDITDVVAIGECGLDSRINTPLSVQKEILELQISQAVENRLPLILHNRDANQPLLEILKQHESPYGGVIHGFSGSYELAKQFWDKGFYIGIGGTITYPRAKKTRRMVSRMPLEALLLETDSPDMPLYGYQGWPNSPAQLPRIAQELSVLTNLPIEKIRDQTTQNAINCFRLHQKSVAFSSI